MSQIVEFENQAVAFRAAGKTAEEIESLNKILELDPNFVRAHLALSMAYIKAQEYAKAAEHAEKACQLEPNDPFNFTALSVTYQRVFAGTQDTSFITKAEQARDLAQRIRAQG